MPPVSQAEAAEQVGADTLTLIAYTYAMIKPTLYYKHQLARLFNKDARTIAKLHLICDATDGQGRPLYSYDNARKQIIAAFEAKLLPAKIIAAKAAKLAIGKTTSINL